MARLRDGRVTFSKLQETSLGILAQNKRQDFLSLQIKANLLPFTSIE